MLHGHRNHLIALVVAMASPIRSLRIAIQGSGIAAAACAERLSKRHDVTIFESGRGPGGRMSTRRAQTYQFDHGAQYFSPKTDAFAAAVDKWCAAGLCAPWTGEKSIWTADRGVSPDPKAAMATRYVGSPGMSSICQGLLGSVKTVCDTRAVAKRSSEGWALHHGKSGKSLGDFDFLICSDKTSAARHRSDYDSVLLNGFAGPASAVRSTRSLALMVATRETGLGFASLLLDDHPAFSWVARDDSKPGRERTDGAECWVAHSSPAFAEHFLKNFHQKTSPNAMRDAIVTELLPHFKTLVSDLNGGVVLQVLLAQGHRWGAAIPTTAFDPSVGTDFYLDSDLAFAACGDYFTSFPGRVEGGWISGTSLADAILQ